ncbi:MAG: PDZ domain-containing protein [Candidatus Colwellbacteria bacterium]|nr:PDZ domain-containing protein [Candidatus Colwellbacteria bacterium]
MEFNIKKIIIFVVIALAIGGGIALLVSRFPSLLSPGNSPVESSSDAAAVCTDSIFAKVVEKNSPGVISVIAAADYEAIKDCGVGSVIGKSPDYAGHMEVSCVKPGASTSLKLIRGGTGFFVSTDGWVVTSSVAVPDQNTPFVIIVDNHTFKATVSFVDKNEGISILKTEASDRPWLKFGKVSDIALNNKAVAIGIVPGQRKVVSSMGTIKSVGRDFSIPLKSGYVDFKSLVETDMPFDMAVFSAPLLNEKGDVIGVNIGYSPSSGALFATGERVETIVKSVINTGDWNAPYIGLFYNKVPEGFKVTGRGALSVIPGSPAAKAGLREGDIIYQIDGVDVQGISDMGETVRYKQVGDIVNMRVQRSGQTIDIEVILETSAL